MPGDDLYWSPVEADTEESFQGPEPYIDPWDLENYVYIRENLDYLELNSAPSLPSNSSCELAEASSHSFHYIPGHGRRRRSSFRKDYESIPSEHGNYVAIDEMTIYERRPNDSYPSISRRRILNGYESESDDTYTYGDGSSKGNSIFGIYDENGIFRRVSLPVPVPQTRDRSLSFSFGETDYSSYESPDTYQRKNRTSRHKRPMVLYSESCEWNPGKPGNFGLSQQGHLQIDYSCNWNNLNKYMKYN